MRKFIVIDMSLSMPAEDIGSILRTHEDMGQPDRPWKIKIVNTHGETCNITAFYNECARDAEHDRIISELNAADVKPWVEIAKGTTVNLDKIIGIMTVDDRRCYDDKGKAITCIYKNVVLTGTDSTNISYGDDKNLRDKQYDKLKALIGLKPEHILWGR